MSSMSGTAGPAGGVSVARSIAVDVPQARAFDLFVDMTAWWPLDTHTIGEAPARASIVEPRAGGRWYGIGRDGVEHGIGHVLAYEPPHRLLLSWEISHDWQYDPSLRTEVEITFTPESETRTRVDLVHRGLEAYGEFAETQRKLYDGDDAWEFILQRYAAAANA